MSAPTGTRIIPLGPEHADEALRLDQAAFAFPMGEIDPDLDLREMEWDRTFAAVRPAAGAHRHATGSAWSDDEELAGLMTSYSLDLTVPGPGAQTRTVPMAGLSWVSVHPDHRRRGVLTEMIRHHLHGLRGGGEPISGLFASEPAIYQRFGYADAASSLSLTVPTGAALHPIPGTDEVSTQLTGTSIEGAIDAVLTVAHADAAARPGGIARSRSVLESVLRDRPERYPGAELTKLVLARRGDEPTGYAVFRRKMDWHEGIPRGRAVVLQLVALDAPSRHALWTRVLNLDLTTEVEAPMIGPDDPLLWWLVDGRTANALRGDALWLRLVDVDRALAARGYAHDVDVVLEVTDEFCPWNAGRWRLTVTGDDARCTATDDDADLGLDVRALGAAYLGGTSLAALAAAGLVVEHRTGAVGRLSTALRGLVEPAVPQMF